MIIECVNCNKKFEVDSSLIPQSGRTLQCGFCNHKWFFKKNEERKINDLIIDQNISENLIKSDQKSKILKKIKTKKTDQTNKKLNISKFLSYILIFIISIIAIIVILDTFKTPLGKFLPNLDFILFNLFESIKDILLFIKDIFS